MGGSGPFTLLDFFHKTFTNFCIKRSQNKMHLVTRQTRCEQLTTSLRTFLSDCLVLDARLSINGIRLFNVVRFLDEFC